jgi:lysophospholipase L1-like esterase
MIKKALQNAGLAVASSLIMLLLAEGVYALVRGETLDTSLSFKALDLLTGGMPDQDLEVYAPLITRPEAFEELLDEFEADGVGLGNSQYEQLRTDRAELNTVVDGCKAQKANLDKEMTYLRAGLYEPFSLVTAFYDFGSPLHPEVRAFIDRYGTRRVRHRTNDRGERLTLPAVETEDKVIVAGDSVANGALVNDDETLASRLQQLDPARQYVNIGIGGADADEIACALKRAAQRYRGQISELIYIYCENDLKDDKPMGQPAEVISWLKQYVTTQGIEKVTIVYAPYIYNIVPYLTRFRGYRGGDFDSHKDERERLIESARKAGFDFVDMAELALHEIEIMGTQFAALTLFVDHVHWSPSGTMKLAEHLTARRNSGVSTAHRRFSTTGNPGRRWRWAAFGRRLIAKVNSISTGAPRGSSATPIAERAWWPAWPSSLTRISEAASITLGC